MEKEELLRLQATMNNREIAEHVGISPKMVWYWTDKYGSPTPRHNKISEETWAKVEAMLDDGCSQREISRTLGMAPITIRRRFPGRGWSKQQTREYIRVLRKAAKEEEA